MSAKNFMFRSIVIILLIAGNLTVASADDFEVYFIHQSCGENWLDSGMRGAVNSAKTARGHSFKMYDNWSGNGDHREWPDRFRYDSDWKKYDIVMFKCCYPASDISSSAMLKQYKDIYTGYLTKLFRENPDILFIIVTAPPLVPNSTNANNADRAREFNNWLENDFIDGYSSANPGLNNVAVFDFFDVLADDNNMLKSSYRVSNDDSHPNSKGNKASTAPFLTVLKESTDTWAGSGGSQGSVKAPVKLKAKARKGGKMLIKWKDKSKNEKGFELERKDGKKGDWSVIATIKANMQKYTDLKLEAGTKYYYRMRAFNNDGYSAYSNISKKSAK